MSWERAQGDPRARRRDCRYQAGIWQADGNLYPVPGQGMDWDPGGGVSTRPRSTAFCRAAHDYGSGAVTWLEADGEHGARVRLTAQGELRITDIRAGRRAARTPPSVTITTRRLLVQDRRLERASLVYAATSPAYQPEGLRGGDLLGSARVAEIFSTACAASPGASLVVVGGLEVHQAVGPGCSPAAQERVDRALLVAHLAGGAPAHRGPLLNRAAGVEVDGGLVVAQPDLRSRSRG